MRDINDPDTLAAQVRDNVKQDDLLGVGQRGGWFIKNDSLGLNRQRTCDFDHLLVGNRQATNARLRGKPTVQPLQDSCGIRI